MTARKENGEIAMTTTPELDQIMLDAFEEMAKTGCEIYEGIFTSSAWATKCALDTAPDPDVALKTVLAGVLHAIEHQHGKLPLSAFKGAQAAGLVAEIAGFVDPE